jgi:hypothetical protein
MVKYLAVYVIGLILSGCATMDREECQVADWRAIGYEDGAKGRPFSYLGKHRKACAEFGITPDLDRYEEGRLAGLVEYCTPRRGYESGRSGQKLNQVCRPPLDKEFELAWSLGAEVYAARVKLYSSEQQLKKQVKYIDELKQEIEVTEDDLVRDGINSRERKFLLEELKSLLADQEDAENELTELQDRVDEDRDHLNQVESHYSY